MRHRARVSTFGRKTGPRKALIRGLVYSLVEHGRIKTTLAKAKELRRHVERAVTLGKKNTLHARRLLLERYPNESAVAKIMSDISPSFLKTPGGYTRVLKIGQRPGDKAEMAFIEFVNYAPKEKLELTEAEQKSVDSKKLKQAKAKKKKLRKISSRAKVVLRKSLQ